MAAKASKNECRRKDIFGRLPPVRLAYILGSGLFQGALLYYATYLFLFQSKGLDSCLPSDLPVFVLVAIGLWAVIAAVVLFDRAGCLAIGASFVAVVLGYTMAVFSGAGIPTIQIFCKNDCASQQASACYTLARTYHSVEMQTHYGRMACDYGSFGACNDLANRKAISIEVLCEMALTKCPPFDKGRGVSIWDEMACLQVKRDRTCD